MLNLFNNFLLLLSTNIHIVAIIWFYSFLVCIIIALIAALLWHNCDFADLTWWQKNFVNIFVTLNLLYILLPFIPSRIQPIYLIGHNFGHLHLRNILSTNMRVDLFSHHRAAFWINTLWLSIIFICHNSATFATVTSYYWCVIRFRISVFNRLLLLYSGYILL